MNNGRKFSGAKYHARRKKRSHSLPGKSVNPVLGEPRRKVVRTRGGNVKVKSLREDSVNVFDGKKVVVAKIKNVVETPQNAFLARQNRLMKSAVIDTSVGKARITNRPSQEGFVNAVLVLEKN